MSNIIYKEQLEYLISLRPEPDELLPKMEKFALEKKVPILDWKSAELLEQVVMMSKPMNVLEIGCAIGYSSIRIGRKLKKGASLDTIEKSKPNIALANKFIEESKLKNINILEGDALKIMPELKKEYDLIFLDADKKDYEKLFLFSLMLLKKKGILFVDNLLWYGYAAAKKVPPEYAASAAMIKEFNRLFVFNDSLDVTILPVGDGIGIGIKK